LHSINTVNNLPAAKSGRRGEGAVAVRGGGGAGGEISSVFPDSKKWVPIEPRYGKTTDETPDNLMGRAGQQ